MINRLASFAALFVLLLSPALMAAPEASSTTAFADAVERELRENILPFWLTRVPDPERGGYFGEVSNEGVPRLEADRGGLLTTRMLWTFSAAAAKYHDSRYRAEADRAFIDLTTRFWDKEHGGLYWRLSATDAVLDSGKQVYLQVFGIYGLSEYYRLTRNGRALELAMTLYRRLQQHAFDPAHGGYIERLARDWSPAPPGRNPLGTFSAAKSQNTNLHVMEALTGLYRASGDADVRASLVALVNTMLDRILDPRTWHLTLYLSRDWQRLSERVSYGHDIEASWLLVDAAEAAGDAALLQRCRKVALSIADTVLREGVDPDGGMLYEVGPGARDDLDKEWWPQAEALVGFINAWQISGDPRYLAAAQRTWHFVMTHLRDPKHGEWFRATDRAGNVRPGMKASFWKCPYHNSRACLEAINRLRATR